jgi:uncharacterized protein (DUF488 family)
VRRVVTIGVYGWTLGQFLEALRAVDVRVLFDVRQRRCVERDPAACHRSIIAARLAASLGAVVTDLRP